MRDYAHADGNGNHRQNGASGKQKTGCGRIHPCEGKNPRNLGVGLITVFAQIYRAAMQHWQKKITAGEMQDSWKDAGSYLMIHQISWG